MRQAKIQPNGVIRVFDGSENRRKRNISKAPNVGDDVVTKLRTNARWLGVLLAAIGVLLPGGCGGGGTTNVIAVTVFSSVGNVLILGQSTTLTATVTGATNTDVNWQPCQYTTTTTDSTGKSTTSALLNCLPIMGTLSNQQTTGTATFLAPQVLPDVKTYPGLQIVISAQSVQNTNKTGKVTLTLNSGIGVVLTPSTATVATLEPQGFQVQLTNDLQTKGVTWQITQQIPSSSTSSTPNPYFNLATCSPSCGAITTDPTTPNGAIYTAPDKVPTAIFPAQTNNTTAPANVTVVATSAADQTRYTLGTLTIIAGGPITFNGITPKIAPQGAAFWDIWLDAPNISSASQIVLNFVDPANPQNVTQVPYNSASGQVKVTFPIPTATTPNPSSSGARLRLFEQDLAPVNGTDSPIVTVTDPKQTVTPSTLPSGAAAKPYTFQFVPVRPTTTATIPNNVVQGSLTQNQDPVVTIDGGYFGKGGGLASVSLQSPGTTIPLAKTSSSRRLSAQLTSATLINTVPPGLYPIYVKSGIAAPNPLPNPNNPAASNIAFFPDFSSTKPSVLANPTTTAGMNPSAMDIDPDLGILVVADTGSSPGQIEFFQIGSGGTLTPLPPTLSTPTAPINVPTGISVNRRDHTVAVVNYGSLDSSGHPVQGSQSVTVLPIPTAPPPTITAYSIDLSNVFQNSVSPSPMPYSIGVDPDSGLALVAYSSNSLSSITNIGLILNLNPNSGTNPYGCLLGSALSGGTGNSIGQCISSQVTLNTGTYPRIAVAQHGHLALVTPGGSGVVRGVDVTKPSTANLLLSSSLAAGQVTVTIDAKHCPPPTPDPTSTTNLCPFSMVPGNSGTVLIAGATTTPSTTANASLFNGLYNVSVTSGSTFTYAVPNSTATGSASGGTVFYGGPDLIFQLAPTLQGVAINPITNTAAMADANGTGTSGAQIDLLSGLDQSGSSISFLANCTAFVTPCSSQPELPPTTEVAWQPFTNALISYNPTQKLVSISDPSTNQRYAIVNVTKPSAVSFPVLNGTANTNLTLWGGLVVDPATNQAFVLESGSAPNTAGTIEVINLGPAVKSAHISDLIVPSPTPGPGVIGGIPNALVPQATLTCNNPIPPATCDLANVQIFGTGFDSNTQVRLDGVSIPAGNATFVSSRQLTVTIPGASLGAPRRYALDVVNSLGVQSNVTDFIVMQSVDMSNFCPDSNGNAVNTRPTSVAIADQIANGLFSPIAVVSNQGCNSISVIDINPANTTFGQFIAKQVHVGLAPQGIAISQRRGLAVVANNGAATASIIDLTTNPPVQKVPDVATGTNPAGVAINEATDVALTANTGSNTVTMINYGLLFPPAGTAAATTLTPISIGGIQLPTAVAIDPDRGTNSQGIAVVSAIQLSSGSAASGALAVVEIGLATPLLSTTINSGFVSSTPTGVVFDPAVATGTANPGVFFANSSGTNSILQFNPDNGSESTVSVGINPTSLAVNPQTGALLTSNSASNSVSIVDTLSSPFKTRRTLGLPGSPTFGVAIDQFTNLAVIVDQVNQRVLLFPMPN